MTWSEFTSLVRADLARYAGGGGRGAFRRHFGGTPGFRYMAVWRWCVYLQGRPLLRALFGLPSRWMLGHCTYRYGIAIPLETRIGPGLYIGHFGGIHVNEHVVIGSHCNLNQDVTIGKHNRGERRGSPVLGDRVYVAPGARIFGGIRIGNDVAIGANAVVTRDLPDHAVAVGIPARVISMQGTAGYIREAAGEDGA